jgi:hypothetical protein
LLGFRQRKPLERRTAQLAGVAVAIGVERPAPFPGVDRAGQRSRIGNRPLDSIDNGIGMSVGKRDAGFSEPRHCRLEGGAGVGGGVLPSGCLQHRQRARTLRRVRFGRPL